MKPEDRSVQINISAIPVAGVGGLGLVAMAAFISIVLPELRWQAASGLLGGAVIGLSLVLIRRHMHGTGPSGDDPTILFRAETADDRSVRERPDSPIPRLPDPPIYSTL